MKTFKELLWRLSKFNLELNQELIYCIMMLPTDQKELITLLTILNPLPEND